MHILPDGADHKTLTTRLLSHIFWNRHTLVCYRDSHKTSESQPKRVRREALRLDHGVDNPGLCTQSETRKRPVRTPKNL
jgi:hypothetical protein